jgi:hypothetical protein
MFVTGLVRMRASDTKISLKEKLHKLKRTVQVTRMRKIKRKKRAMFKFSEMK